HLRYTTALPNCFTNLSLPNLEALRMGSGFIDSNHSSGAMEKHQIFQFDPAVLKNLAIVSPWYLTDSMQAGLLEVLGRTTQLRSLTLPQDEFTNNFDVPKDLIPNLEIFDGPVNLVLKFCKGRPIRDLRMSIPERGDWERKIDVRSLIPPGSVPLEHLSISGCEWEDDTMELIARHCPELVSLRIRAIRVTGTLSTRHPMPKLRNATLLSFYGEWYENDDLGTALASEERIVRDCKESWTELEYLRLNRDYFRRYRGLEVERYEGKEVEDAW
ncbi:hypothetical protein FRC01_005413, partial [Tulasnella sp. 417]